MLDTDQYDDNVMYALTWRSPEDLLYYWSVRKGWTYSAELALVLSQLEVENIENDDRLQSKLPQHKERRDGANWEPIYRRYTSYAPGVIDDDTME